MRILASDLDQTLIYSKKWVEEENEAVCVEYKDGEPLSFMLKDGLELLQTLNEDNQFIPITTRTNAQYQRIDFSFVPKLAVVANGAIILRDNVIDEEWAERISRQLDLSSSFETMKLLIEKLFDVPGVEKIRAADNHFLYLLVDVDAFDVTLLSEVEAQINENKWEIYNQGRKVYFIPQVITKGNALAYLREREGFEKIISAGDSSLDASMLEASDSFLVPGHSALDGHYKCQERGLKSGLELLTHARRSL